MTIAYSDFYDELGENNNNSTMKGACNGCMPLNLKDFILLFQLKEFKLTRADTASFSAPPLFRF